MNNAARRLAEIPAGSWSKWLFADFWDRRDARHGAITGLAATSGVITSAGFVLAGTFAALTTA